MSELQSVLLDDFFAGEEDVAERLIACLQYVCENKKDVQYDSDTLFTLIEKGLSYKGMKLYGDTLLSRISYSINYFVEFNECITMLDLDIVISRIDVTDIYDAVVNIVNHFNSVAISTLPFYLLLQSSISRFALIYIHPKHAGKAIYAVTITLYMITC